MKTYWIVLLVVSGGGSTVKEIGPFQDKEEAHVAESELRKIFNVNPMWSAKVAIIQRTLAD